jgi:hypothetical protein
MSARFITGVLVLAVAVVTLFLIRPSPPPIMGDLAAAHPDQRALPMKPAMQAVTPLPIAAEAGRLNAPDGICREDLGFLDLVISQYRIHLDGNPVGDNREISAALRGENDKRIALLPRDGAFLDKSEQLVDRWGTPYFFHAMNSRQMEIHSAGPDRELWTADDITLPPSAGMGFTRLPGGGVQSPPRPAP